MNTTARREFLIKSLGLFAAAGAVGSSAGGVWAQIQEEVRRPGRYEDLLILDRKPFLWPGGRTVAVWIIPNVEVFMFDPNEGIPNANPAEPDLINYSQRDYGMRVGLWRIADVMEAAGIKATVALNAGVCKVFPKAMEQMNKLGWEMMGHGITNSRNLRGLSLDEEREVIQTTLSMIEQSTGKKVKGWLGPGLGETFNTPDLLAELGVKYTGDWNNDELPYRMKVKKGEFYSLPYWMDVNDISFYRLGRTGEEYYQAVAELFDNLYADSKKIPRVLGLPLHPFLTGQPVHIKYFRKVIDHIKQHDKVWFATGGEIIDAYQKVQT